MKIKTKTTHNVPNPNDKNNRPSLKQIKSIIEVTVSVSVVLIIFSQTFFRVDEHIHLSE